MTGRIMVVEDEVIVALDVQQRLKVLGYEVAAHAVSGEDAVRGAREVNPDLILMDIKIQGEMDGIEAASEIHESLDIPVIYLTAYADDATLQRAGQTEAFGYLIKPFEDHELRSAIEIALYKHKIERKLHDSEERYRRLVETSPDGIIIADLNGCIIESNEKNTQLWGYANPQEMIGLSASDLVVPEDRAYATDYIRNVIAGKKSSAMECRCLRKNGSYFIGEINGAGLHDAFGRVSSIFAITRDITQRKLAEEAIQKFNIELVQRVASRTAALEASNKELESFAYSVSHDLRTPLRAMMGFSQILLDEYENELDSQGQDYLARIEKASRTMSVLIDDLLKLSKISRTAVHMSEVDLAKIARDISQVLHGAQPERNVEFIIPEKLMVKADPVLIQIVLENLIGNAWKFSSKIERSRIELGSTIREGKTLLFVKDNGVGFNMAYVDKLFGAFQRLHSKHEYEGSGIGLSIVQRIIHRLGGQVWAESEPGQGATFYFTLPGNAA